MSEGLVGDCYIQSTNEMLILVMGIHEMVGKKTMMKEVENEVINDSYLYTTGYINFILKSPRSLFREICFKYNIQLKFKGYVKAIFHVEKERCCANQIKRINLSLFHSLNAGGYSCYV